MELSKKEVLNLANLAKLKLTEEEIEKYQEQMVGILNYVNKINELDLENVKESLTGAENIVGDLREDVVKTSNPDLIEHAPETKDNYIVVPKVLDK